MALGLANGQLSAASATVLGAGTAERTVALTLYNTSRSVVQEVILTVSRQGGTARTVFRAKMQGRETWYLDGVKLDPADVLAGYATYAAAVDYDVTVGQGPLTVWARDEDGAPKQSTDVELTLTEKASLTVGEVRMIGLLEEIRDGVFKIA